MLFDVSHPASKTQVPTNRKRLGIPKLVGSLDVRDILAHEQWGRLGGGGRRRLDFQTPTTHWKQPVNSCPGGCKMMPVDISWVSHSGTWVSHSGTRQLGQSQVTPWPKAMSSTCNNLQDSCSRQLGGGGEGWNTSRLHPDLSACGKSISWNYTQKKQTVHLPASPWVSLYASIWKSCRDTFQPLRNNMYISAKQLCGSLSLSLESQSMLLLCLAQLKFNIYLCADELYIPQGQDLGEEQQKTSGF